MNIAVGVAGWSYPDWDGYVYPRRVGDKLTYISRYVDMIEINSTFYRPPDAKTAASWLKRIRDLPKFFFTVKIHHEVSHSGQITPAMARAFHEGLRPLTEDGRLQCLLAQFPWNFVDSPPSRSLMKRIADSLGSIAGLTFELRHDSWQQAEPMQFIKGLGAGVASLDYPMGSHSFRPIECMDGRPSYLRLHGRNISAWFDPKANRDAKYDYLYSVPEVTAIAQRSIELARRSASLTVVANNHYQGKEVVTALQLKSQISGTRIPVPPLLLNRYPQLTACVLQEMAPDLLCEDTGQSGPADCS